MARTQAPPPAAVLIKTARLAALISTSAAAAAIGYSKGRWSQVETGWQRRGGRRKRVNAPPELLALMAGAVGVTADELETAGERPDAAAVLRKMRARDAEGVLDGLSPAVRDALIPLSDDTRAALAHLDRAVLAALAERGQQRRPA